MQNCAGKEFNLHSDQIRFKLKTSNCFSHCSFCPLSLKIELTNNDYEWGGKNVWTDGDVNWRMADSVEDTGKFIHTGCTDIKCQK